MSSGPETRVRIRPGGTATTVLAGLAWLCVLVFLGGVLVVIGAGSGALVGLVVLAPSAVVLIVAVYLAQRAASGFVLDARGIHGAAQPPRDMAWSQVRGLRWVRTRHWGSSNVQLAAEHVDGRTVVVWGVRSPAQHDRLVAGLRRAEQAGLIPVTVGRAVDLHEPWAAVHARLH